jgi:hypothetical protein
MTGSGYQGGTTTGGKWGCAFAALVGVPLFSFLIIVQALGDCSPDVEYHSGFWAYVVLPTIAAALPVGLAVRVVVNRFWGSGG